MLCNILPLIKLEFYRKFISKILRKCIDKTKHMLYNNNDESGPLLSLVRLTLQGHTGNGGAYPKLRGLCRMAGI